MPSFKDRMSAKLARFRGRHRKVEHAFGMVSHYGDVHGNAQAGAVTFFGFLSFFPILALAFFAVGVLAQVYPELKSDIRVEIENLFPGVVGGDEGEIPLKTFEEFGTTLGVVGALGLLYSGLGWLGAMREALEAVFLLPRREKPNLVVGKLRDMGTLVLLGLVLIVSVALSGAVAGFSERLLGWVGLDPDAAAPNVLLLVLSHGLAIAASTVLLIALFTLLAKPHVPRRSLFDGALLGAIGFELLKEAAYFLIELTKGNPAFQAFGVSLILLVWINYFSRLVMFAASYAYTSPAAVDLRAAEAMRAPAAPFADAAVAEHATVAPATPVVVPDPSSGDRRPGTLLVAACSALTGAGVAAFVARRRGRIEQ